MWIWAQMLRKHQKHGVLVAFGLSGRGCQYATPTSAAFPSLRRGDLRQAVSGAPGLKAGALGTHFWCLLALRQVT